MNWCLGVCTSVFSSSFQPTHPPTYLNYSPSPTAARGVGWRTPSFLLSTAPRAAPRKEEKEEKGKEEEEEV